RPPAFEVIVSALKINTATATRAAFVGRNEILQRVRKVILNENNKSLSAILIQGQPGIGKSRLIEQLRIDCLVDSVYFGVCNCTDDSSALEPITSAILDLLRWRQSKRTLPVELIMAASGEPLGAFDISEHESPISTLQYPIERSIS